MPMERMSEETWVLTHFDIHNNSGDWPPRHQEATVQAKSKLEKCSLFLNFYPLNLYPAIRPTLYLSVRWYPCWTAPTRALRDPSDLASNSLATVWGIDMATRLLWVARSASCCHLHSGWCRLQLYVGSVFLAWTISPTYLSIKEPFFRFCKGSLPANHRAMVLVQFQFSLA